MSKMDTLHRRLERKKQDELNQAVHSLGHSILVASAALGMLARILLGTQAFSIETVNSASQMFERSKSELPDFVKSFDAEAPSLVETVKPYTDQLMKLNDEFDIIIEHIHAKFAEQFRAALDTQLDADYVEKNEMIDPNKSIAEQIEAQEDAAGFNRAAFIQPDVTGSWTNENGEVVAPPSDEDDEDDFPLDYEDEAYDEDTDFGDDEDDDDYDDFDDEDDFE